MKKIKYFIFLFGFMLFMIPNVNAEEYVEVGYLNDFTVVSANKNSEIINVPKTTNTYVGNVNGIILSINNYQFTPGLTYVLEIYFTRATFNSNAKQVIVSSSNDACSYISHDFSTSTHPKFRFSCSKQPTDFQILIYGNSETSVIMNGTNVQWNNTFLRYINLNNSGATDTIIKDQTSIIIDKQDKTNEKLDETNKELGELNENITDESAPNTDDLSDASGWLPPGPLDSLINLPLSLFNAISRDLSATCEPIVLPLPYVDKDLTLPCIASLYDKIGIQDFINWVGRFVSAFILFSYLMKLYKWVDDTLSFRENNHLDNWGGI